ncbi:2-amino-4-hydroxy-6-hydroxymethyldihydropteridine diphosphokinase [Jannaschia sp. 2305UL9-9]|uniref:2-amino-4-hydroxy-6- hydroxymethyldihydropteridine diphosphokinase n=1 Tax=Jannaschia sp. 2305UL9-9 TaxID=3121638 RepID=UPI003528C0DB
MTLHLIALGANSGATRAANARKVARAACALRAVFGPSVRVSALYATPAWPPGIGPEFVNAAACVSSHLSPKAVLTRLHRIEARFGRTRSVRWGARVLDLDLIGSDGLVRPDGPTVRGWMHLAETAQGISAPDHLVLPHPRVQDRGFVLIPMADVAPGWRHPITGRSIGAMAAGLSVAARRGIRRLHPI